MGGIVIDHAVFGDGVFRHGGVVIDNDVVAILRPVLVIDKLEVFLARNTNLKVGVAADEDAVAHDDLSRREGHVVVRAFGDEIDEVDVLQVLAVLEAAVGQEDGEFRAVTFGEVTAEVSESDGGDVFVSGEGETIDGDGLVGVVGADVVVERESSLLLVEFFVINSGHLQIADGFVLRDVGGSENLVHLEASVARVQADVVFCKEFVVLAVVELLLQFQRVVEHGEEFVAHAGFVEMVFAGGDGNDAVGVGCPVRVSLEGIDEVRRDADIDALPGVKDFFGGDDLCGSEIFNLVAAREFVIDEVDAGEVGAAFEGVVFDFHAERILGAAEVGVHVAEVEAFEQLVVAERQRVDADETVGVVGPDVVVERKVSFVLFEIVVADARGVDVVGVRFVGSDEHWADVEADIVLLVTLQNGLELGVVGVIFAAQLGEVEAVLFGTVDVALIDSAVFVGIESSALFPGDDAVGVGFPACVGFEGFDERGPDADEGVVAAEEQGVVGGNDLVGLQCFVAVGVGVAIDEVHVLQRRAFGEGIAAEFHLHVGVDAARVGAVESDDAQVGVASEGIRPDLGGAVGVGRAGVVEDDRHAAERGAEFLRGADDVGEIDGGAVVGGFGRIVCRSVLLVVAGIEHAGFGELGLAHGGRANQLILEDAPAGVGEEGGIEFGIHHESQLRTADEGIGSGSHVGGGEHDCVRAAFADCVAEIERFEVRAVGESAVGDVEVNPFVGFVGRNGTEVGEGEGLEGGGSQEGVGANLCRVIVVESADVGVDAEVGGRAQRGVERTDLGDIAGGVVLAADGGSRGLVIDVSGEVGIVGLLSFVVANIASHLVFGSGDGAAVFHAAVFDVGLCVDDASGDAADVVVPSVDERAAAQDTVHGFCARVEFADDAADVAFTIDRALECAALHPGAHVCLAADAAPVPAAAVGFEIAAADVAADDAHVVGGETADGAGIVGALLEAEEGHARALHADVANFRAVSITEESEIFVLCVAVEFQVFDEVVVSLERAFEGVALVFADGRPAVIAAHVEVLDEACLVGRVSRIDPLRKLGEVGRFGDEIVAVGVGGRDGVIDGEEVALVRHDAVGHGVARARAANAAHVGAIALDVGAGEQGAARDFAVVGITGNAGDAFVARHRALETAVRDFGVERSSRDAAPVEVSAVADEVGGGDVAVGDARGSLCRFCAAETDDGTNHLVAVEGLADEAVDAEVLDFAAAHVAEETVPFRVGKFHVSDCVVGTVKGGGVGSARLSDAFPGLALHVDVAGKAGVVAAPGVGLVAKPFEVFLIIYGIDALRIFARHEGVDDGLHCAAVFGRVVGERGTLVESDDGTHCAFDGRDRAARSEHALLHLDAAFGVTEDAAGVFVAPQFSFKTAREESGVFAGAPDDAAPVRAAVVGIQLPAVHRAVEHVGGAGMRQELSADHTHVGGCLRIDQPGRFKRESRDGTALDDAEESGVAPVGNGEVANGVAVAIQNAAKGMGGVADGLPVDAAEVHVGSQFGVDGAVALSHAVGNPGKLSLASDLIGVARERGDVGVSDLDNAGFVLAAFPAHGTEVISSHHRAHIVLGPGFHLRGGGQDVRHQVRVVGMSHNASHRGGCAHRAAESVAPDVGIVRPSDHTAPAVGGAEGLQLGVRHFAANDFDVFRHVLKSVLSRDISADGADIVRPAGVDEARSVQQDVLDDDRGEGIGACGGIAEQTAVVTVAHLQMTDDVARAVELSAEGMVGRADGLPVGDGAEVDVRCETRVDIALSAIDHVAKSREVGGGLNEIVAVTVFVEHVLRCAAQCEEDEQNGKEEPPCGGATVCVEHGCGV